MSPEPDTVSLNLKETELTLGLPGESRTPTHYQPSPGGKINFKRGFSETVDFQIGSGFNGEDQIPSSISVKPPAPKAQIVGWPPVRSFRKNVLNTSSSIPSKSIYVKVAVDGAPYLRKVDLNTYSSYQELLLGLQNLFTFLTLGNQLGENKLIDRVKGIEYVPTYEDKDGDWMLVGDVPWKMFSETCKRVRLMISTNAIGLAPGTPPNSQSQK